MQDKAEASIAKRDEFIFLFVAIINAQRQFAVIYLARFKNEEERKPKINNSGVDKIVQLIDFVFKT